MQSAAAGTDADTQQIGQHHPCPLAQQRFSACDGLPALAGTGGTSRKGLSLRGLVHLLWTKAGLTSWHPMWAGRRTWSVVQGRLVEAAAQFQTERFHLERVLFVPEQYRDSAKVDIQRRRTAALSQLDDPLNKMLIIAELKDLPTDPVRDANIPFQVAIKQIHFGLMIAHEKIGVFEHRVRKARGALAGASTQGKLLIAGTFSKIGNDYWLRDFIVVAATDNWLLVESRRERELLEYMERTGKSFQQGLRFELDRNSMIANVTSREGLQICVRSADQADEAERQRFRADCIKDGVPFVEWSSDQVPQ